MFADTRARVAPTRGRDADHMIDGDLSPRAFIGQGCLGSLLCTPVRQGKYTEIRPKSEKTFSAKSKATLLDRVVSLTEPVMDDQLSPRAFIGQECFGILTEVQKTIGRE